MTVVYADLTFLLNTGLNCLIFCCTMRLSGLPVRRLRTLAASALGGIYAVFAAIPVYGFLTAFLAKCMASLLMARVAFGKDPYFLRRYLLFLVASCTLSGASVGAAAILRQTESPWVVFFFSGLFCAFALAVVFHRAGDPKEASGLLEATITCAGNSVTVPLLQDTGNTLRDPESGQIVCIVWDRALQPLGVQAYRKIPFQSLGQPGGELDCFTCDSLTIGSKTWRNYPVGVSLHPLGGGGYVGLWGGEMEGANDHVEKTAQPLGPSGNLASRRRALHRRQRHPAPAPAPGGGDGAVGTAGGRGLGGPPDPH